METLEERIDLLLKGSPYCQPPADKTAVLLELLRELLDYSGEKSKGVQNYLRQWPVDFRLSRTIADLPFLPVGLLKAEPPLSLVETRQIKITLTSSSTTGQRPSRVVLDAPTALRMTKGVAVIIRDFIGADRRPYLVVDVPDSTRSGVELGARGAAIRALQPFANVVEYGLTSGSQGELTLELDKVLEFARSWRQGAALVYGFTFILWKYLVKPLLAAGISLDMPNIHVLHSGGWKRLEEEAVEKPEFNAAVAKVFGCSPPRVIDFYGMVENVGIVYPDCPEGNKHVPRFGEVIVRNPLSLQPVVEGELGILQACSALPTSFPGQLLLTEDLAQVMMYDGCPCGRRGIGFRFAGRVPKAELRGCGNIANR